MQTKKIETGSHLREGSTTDISLICTSISSPLGSSTVKDSLLGRWAADS